MSGPEHAAHALVTLRGRVDAHFSHAASESGDQMRCAAGCDRCCYVDLTVFEVEATPIRGALASLPAELRAVVRAQSAQREHCAMLVDGRCAVYGARPLICRSHGAPILVESEKGPRVENCELNFTDRAPAASAVLRLAAVNEPLSVLATLWDGAGARVSLRALAAAED